MTHRIKVSPSNRQFEVDEKESLLEAALRAGLNISYSCASGNCGQCKARIVSGDYHFNESSDYKLSEEEKRQKTVLMCRTNARSDLLIEAKEARSAADIPRQSIAARIAKLEKTGDDQMVVHVRTPRSHTLRFLAGQHVTITIAAKTNKQTDVPPQDVAIASCPCNGMILQFHVSRDDHDVFSRYIFHEAKVGGNVLIEGPFGEFTLDEESRRPVVMVAEDGCFAPLKSLIEHAISLDLPQSILLFWLAGIGKTHYLSNYCRSWETALDQFVYFPLTLNEEKDLSAAYADVVGEIVSRSPIESEIDLYLATPSTLANQLAQAFEMRGTPPSRIAITSVC
jgi:CDP-4-dehydro-6-deoxyglucose reductase